MISGCFAAKARTASGTIRSWAQSPPPMILPARTVTTGTGFSARAK